MSAPPGGKTMRPSRRDTLKGIGLAIGTAAIGACGSDAAGTGDDDGTDTDAANIDAAIDAPVDAEIDAPTPEALLAGIDTFVVLMMENRSFDHYFGSLRLVEN